ncbi:MAG: TonB C-terminal domain-containing protein [Candidatus Aminicenantes bacterium]|nr:MAG: TonB C-terminal domain-containing protein [Candidatus Aminicenantes bacterium]
MLKLKTKIAQIIKDNPELKRQGLCFLSSVVIHAIVIFLGLIFIIPIKVYIYEEKTTDVIIVPPDKLLIPELDKYPASIGSFKESSLGEGLEKKSEPSEEEGKFQVDIDQDAAEIAKEHIEDRADKTIPYQGLASGFSLDIPSRSKTKSDLSLDDRLVLPLSSEKKENILKEIGKGYEKRDLDLLRYIYSDYSNIDRSRRTSSPQTPGRRASTRRGRASFQVKDYDISPWAKIVVDRIQKNWVLSPSQKTGAKGEVEIFVIIEKSGELSSVEIIRSSEIQLLDQTALKALNISSPFPKLPDDFPNKNLEAYFVFSYDD